ncbi:ABC transporter ATP-binding protein [Gracilibacillus marinus]|jgi:iron complex transport system ATP-binding protein|uniref:ABC transporter ATP-binding protein n=1 Tax=Gracilibacillus marinus TaxID=630535 RepID=A0ABV8VY24_9BACI
MVIDMKGISLRKSGKWILHNINWQVNKGEHWALVGLNGAGKSALLHMLVADYFPTNGQLSVVGKTFGKDVLGERLRQQIGIVSSSIKGKLYGTDTAYQVILSGGFASIGLYEEPTDTMRKKAIELLKELDCYDYANREFRTLSQGEQQRILIGRALMGNPKLLILDEPTNGLDFIAREKLLDTIESLAKKVTPTMIFVTHHVEEILPTFNKTLLLKRGEVFASGDTSSMLTGEMLSEFFGIKVTIDWMNERPLLRRMN